MVVGVAVVGVALAVVVALTPWPGSGAAYPHVTHLSVPAAAAPRG